MTRKALAMTAAAAVVAASSWTAAARAQDPDGPPPHRGHFGPGFGHGPGGPGFGPGFADELGLTGEQKAQIDALRARQRESTKPLLDAARQAHDAFRNALEADSPDATTVGQAAIAMHAAEKKLEAAHRAAFDEMKAILTPEQRTRLEQMKDRGPRHGPREPRP